MNEHITSMHIDIDMKWVSVEFDTSVPRLAAMFRKYGVHYLQRSGQRVLLLPYARDMELAMVEEFARSVAKLIEMLQEPYDHSTAAARRFAIALIVVQSCQREFLPREAPDEGPMKGYERSNIAISPQEAAEYFSRKDIRLVHQGDEGSMKDYERSNIVTTPQEAAEYFKRLGPSSKKEASS